ncbi:MAG TPA: hypothetical protein VM165_14955, partial [Planctomycetaceae bacterium]|nr:hypothetical protein [Planctomycetaceae bacterium]
MQIPLSKRWLLNIAIAMPLLIGTGCRPDPKGPGSFHATMQAATEAEESLNKLGAKLERKQYPPGPAWAVDLSGKDVT